MNVGEIVYPSTPKLERSAFVDLPLTKLIVYVLACPSSGVTTISALVWVCGLYVPVPVIEALFGLVAVITTSVTSGPTV